MNRDPRDHAVAPATCDFMHPAIFPIATRNASRSPA